MPANLANSFPESRICYLKADENELSCLSNLDLAEDVIDIQYVYDVERAYKILSDK